MASHSSSTSLNLSVLKEGLEYPLNPGTPEGRCLIHVKLTESCAKAIDGLITSNRGAFFSLWFTENGGHLTMPSSSSSDSVHKFQFSTARLNKVETHGKLECLHQALVDKKSQVSCMGVVEHKLNIKATDEVYEATKKRATELEKERQGVRAKEIKIAKITNKSKIAGTTTSSSTGRSTKPGGGSSKLWPGGGEGGGGLAKHPSVIGRTQKTLKERVMYLLALKSLKRSDIVSKLKKATKRGESSLTNLDSVLNEVADTQDGSIYNLKSSLYSDLDVDNWPFYFDAERQMVKRKLATIIRQPPPTTSSTSVPFTANSTLSSVITTATTASVLSSTTTTGASGITSTVANTGATVLSSNSTSSVITGSKRPQEDPAVNQFVSKKSKLSSYPTTSSSSSSAFTVPTSTTSLHSEVIQTSSEDRVPSSLLPSTTTTSTVLTSTYTDTATNSVVKGHKHRKKKKQKHNTEPNESPFSSTGHQFAPAATSSSVPPNTTTTDEIKMEVTVSERTHEKRKMFGSSSSPSDLLSIFPSITNHEQRSQYKKLFNEKYEEYLSLKKAVDDAHNELLQLSNDLESLPPKSHQFKEIKAKVKKKAEQLKQDKHYQEQRTLLLTLHNKLEHLKKMVVQYDSSHYVH